MSHSLKPDNAQPIDRRTRYTLMVIRDAFYELLKEEGFAKLTVSDLCKRAQINRGTFYLHYEDKLALLNKLIDEALDAEPLLDGSPAAMCQRPPANHDYKLLYQDPTTFPYVAARVIERGEGNAIHEIMTKTNLDESDARILFIYTAYGNLAVNRALGWKKGPAFNKVQALLSAFTEGGFERVRV